MQWKNLDFQHEVLHYDMSHFSSVVQSRFEKR